MATNDRYRWSAGRWFLIFLTLGLGAWLYIIGPALWDALVTDVRIAWARMLGEIK